MTRKTVSQERIERTAALRELTGQELRQATGAAATNPLYIPLRRRGTTPLHGGG